MSGDYDYLGSPEFTEQRQRERLCSALVRAISDHGYEAITVARVAELSGYSKETFHRHYEDLADLFCDACSHTLQESRSATVTAWLTVHGWSERLRRSCQALLRHVEDHPAATRAVLVASLGGGPEIADHVRETIAFHERALVMAFQLHPQGFATSRLTPRALTGGMRHVIYLRMCEGRERQIATHADDLHEWIECHRSTAAARLPLMQHPPQPAHRTAARLLDGLAPEPLGLATPPTTPPTIPPTIPPTVPLTTPPTVPTAVDATESDRVMGIVAQLMLQEGLDALDDATVARFAGISAKRFAEDYGGLERCATVHLDRCLERVDAALAAGAARGRDWPESVRLSIVECLRCLDSDRPLARLVLLRLTLVPSVAELRHAALAQRIVSRVLEHSPPPRAGRGFVAEALVGVVGDLLTWVVASGMFARLPALANHISFFLLAPYLGGEAAAEAVIASADAEWLGEPAEENSGSA